MKIGKTYKYFRLLNVFVFLFAFCLSAKTSRRIFMRGKIDMKIFVNAHTFSPFCAAMKNSFFSTYTPTVRKGKVQWTPKCKNPYCTTFSFKNYLFVHSHSLEVSVAIVTTTRLQLSSFLTNWHTLLFGDYLSMKFMARGIS